MLSQAQIETIRQHLNHRYPKWQGCSDPRFVKEELTYKREASKLARELLAPAELQQMPFAILAKRIEKIASATNLLFRGVPKAGDLSLIYDTRIDQEQFPGIFADLLYGAGDPADRIGRFLTYLTERSLPSKWTFPTYFLFLTSPADNLFVKPSRTRAFLKGLGLPELFSSKPTAEAYRSLLSLASEIQAAFNMQGARDFIDVQSIIWVAGNAAEAESSAKENTSAAGQRIWVLAPGEDGRLWGQFQEHGIAAIGWESLGDLTTFGSKEAIAEALFKEKNAGSYPRNDALACWQFCREMQVGDRILVKRGTSEIMGDGIVTSDYIYRPDRVEYKNTRRAEWHAAGSWELPEEIRVPNKTLTDVTDDSTLLEYILPLLKSAASKTSLSTPAPERYTIDEALKGLFVSRDVFLEWFDVLGNRLNVILRGPPGVGKSHIADRLAMAKIGSRDPDRLLRIQFHQSYSYEDFVEGWRPSDKGTFTLRQGHFLDFCQRAATRPTEPHVVLIDEINRGNISRILGELLTLLEPDKRSAQHAMRLTYQPAGETPFFVPSNVYLIAMMNTADRSLDALDYALQRRFAFLDLRPAFHTEQFARHLGGFSVAEDLISHIQKTYVDLNKKICEDTRRLGPGYEIGHSFFVPSKRDSEYDWKWYDQILRTEIAPRLREYWFDVPKVAETHIAPLGRP